MKGVYKETAGVYIPKRCYSDRSFAIVGNQNKPTMKNTAFVLRNCDG